MASGRKLQDPRNPVTFEPEDEYHRGVPARGKGRENREPTYMVCHPLPCQSQLHPGRPGVWAQLLSKILFPHPNRQPTTPASTNGCKEQVRSFAKCQAWCLTHSKYSKTLSFALKPVPNSESSERAKKEQQSSQLAVQARHGRLEWPLRKALISKGVSYNSEKH